ncbi:malonyl CoA-acyl carrier protein transacylase [Alphaproteobacteria bacterium]|nr:malonyl CoA-acyl carrier protein transacylase [Alphaproteobacteria bacterium]
MGKNLYENFSQAKKVLDEADEILGYALSKKMFEGPLEELSQTQFTQPALLTASIMAWEVLKNLYGPSLLENIVCTAGHSVGEYAALVAARFLTFPEALRLVHCRAIEMQKASPYDAQHQPLGGMCAVLGMELPKLQNILEEEFRNQPKRCAIANDNCLGQVVLTGLLADVDIVREKALVSGAKRGIFLPVSGPFHSPWMLAVADVLTEKMQSLTIKNGKFPVFSNVTAAPVIQGEKVKNLLPQQVTHTVRWRASMANMAEQGVTLWLELGSGQVLSGLAKRCLGDSTTQAAQTAEDVRGLENFLKN